MGDTPAMNTPATKLRLTAINLDCADPMAPASFYQRVTGFELHPESGDDFAGLRLDDGFFIGFQRVDDHRPPTWPDQHVPQQFHLDFAVDDLDAGEALIPQLGAVKPAFQPGGEKWRIFTDPAGHPFCLARH